MKVQIKSTFGNFAYSVIAEVSDAQRDAMAAFGLLQIAQRKPATAAEKELGWAGAKKRPEGFKRTDIEFSEANALVLKKHLEAAKLEIGEGDSAKEESLLLEVQVSEYVPEKAEVKWKEEKAKIASKGGDAAKLLALATAVGFAEKDASKLTVENLDFCKAIREFVKRQMAGL